MKEVKITFMDGVVVVVPDTEPRIQDGVLYLLGWGRGTILGAYPLVNIRKWEESGGHRGD